MNEENPGGFSNPTRRSTSLPSATGSIAQGFGTFH